MTILANPVACIACNFTSSDLNLLARHSCDTQQRGGTCEDYPCCGHERGDCNGLLYGSDESIKEQVYRDLATGHGDCDHSEGFCNGGYEEYDEDDEEYECGGCEDPESFRHSCGLADRD